MPYKRGPKWVGQVRKMHQGKQFKKEKKFDTKAEAKAWETRMLSTSVSDWQPTTDTTCLGDWAQEYLDFAKTRFVEKTYKEKASVFVRFFREVDPALPLEELTRSMVLKYIMKQDGSRTGNAANKDRKNLVAAWNWGTRYMDPGLPKDNPCDVEKMTTVPHPRYIPPEEDFWKVVDVLEQGQDKTMLLVALYTAGRKSEIFRLKWTDVDFENRRVRLWTRKRKGGSLESDWLPMTPQLAETLSWWKANTPFVDKEHVFLSLHDTPFCREYFGQPFTIRLQFMRRLCERAGVNRFGFHAIRHLTASILYKAGEPVSVIQAILRHKSPTTTNRYLRSLCVEDVRGALEGICRPANGKVVDIMPRLAAAQHCREPEKKAVRGAVNSPNGQGYFS